MSSLACLIESKGSFFLFYIIIKRFFCFSAPTKPLLHILKGKSGHLSSHCCHATIRNPLDAWNLNSSVSVACLFLLSTQTLFRLFFFQIKETGKDYFHQKKVNVLNVVGKRKRGLIRGLAVWSSTPVVCLRSVLGQDTEPWITRLSACKCLHVNDDRSFQGGQYFLPPSYEWMRNTSVRRLERFCINPSSFTKSIIAERDLRDMQM